MKNIVNLISIFLVIGISLYLFRNPNQLDVLTEISIYTILFLIFIKFLTLLVNSFFNREILKGFGLNISYLEAVYLGSVTFLGNLFLPLRSGANFRLIYLNKKYKFKSPELASMYLYFFVVTIFLNSLVGLICLFFLDLSGDIVFIISIIIFLVMFIFSTFLLIKEFTVSTGGDKIRIISWLKNLKFNWNVITRNRILQSKLIFLTTINYLLFAVEAYIIIDLLFSKNNLFTIFYYNSISVLSSLASFTPASLGLKDLLVFFSSNILTLSVANVITLMIVERAVAVLFSLIPGLLTFSLKKSIR
tara:strand:+ start:2237 stop:3148 length:912 start_codon:yes stop_codon:yes gene_type:complete